MNGNLKWVEIDDMDLPLGETSLQVLLDKCIKTKELGATHVYIQLDDFDERIVFGSYVEKTPQDLKKEEDCRNTPRPTLKVKYKGRFSVDDKDNLKGDFK